MYCRAMWCFAVAVALMFSVGSAEAAKKKKDSDGMVAGKVKSIDVAAGSLVLAGPKGKDGNAKPDTTVKISKDTKVTMAGEAKTIDDVTTGARISVKLGDDKSTAASIELGAKKEKKKKDK